MNPITERNRGRLLVVSGPSGVGKGTVLAILKEKNDSFVYSVSATTRAKREGEEEGVNYFYKTREQFEEMIKNDELLEYAAYNGNYYGTPRAFVEENLARGKNVLLEIETQGAFNVRKAKPDAVLVFIAPETREVLFDRLRGRGTETEEVIKNRVAIAEKELRLCPLYDYVVFNLDGEAEKCADDILAIVRASSLKPESAPDAIRRLVF